MADLIKLAQPISGIDVSWWQGTINWQAVKNAGIMFALLRVYYYRISGLEIFTSNNKSYYFNFWEESILDKKKIESKESSSNLSIFIIPFT